MTWKPKVFRSPNQVGKHASKQAFDHKRGSARDRGYTVAWDKAAHAFRFANPLCLGCRAVGRYIATRVVDHIVPHKGDMSLFWDQDNWQPACSWHHDTVKQVLERMFEQGSIGKAELRLDSATARELTGSLTGDR